MSKLNILHYTFGLPPKATGGLPLYVRDLSETQKKAGHNVNILLPKQRIIGKDKIYKKKGIYYINNSLPVSSVFGMKEPQAYIRKYDKSVVEKFLAELEPTIIHIHSFMGLPKEFLEIAKLKKIKIVYTTHDYYGLCLKCNFIDYAGKVCSGPTPKKCAKCNLSNGLTTKMTYLIGTDFYKAIKKNTFIHNLKSKYRDDKVKKGLISNILDINVSKEQVHSYERLLYYYQTMFSMIDIFHFNSSVSRDVYEKYILNIRGEIVPITLLSIQDYRNKKERKMSDTFTIGYIGRKEPYKGIDLLLEALNQLHKEKFEFKCLLYGDNFSNYEQLLDGKIQNMGVYKKSEQDKVFKAIDLLVIPSICKETFGFVGLEALSYGIPILVSKNAGCKDLLKNEKYIFNDKTDLFNKLTNIMNDLNFVDYKVDIENLLSMHSHTVKIEKIIYENS